MTKSGPDLRRVLGLRDTLALSFGAMVGWSWVILSGVWIESGGSRAVYAMASHGMLPRWLGWLALAGSLGLLLLYLPGSPSALQWPVEWGLVLLWYLLGVIFYRLRARR